MLNRRGIFAVIALLVLFAILHIVGADEALSGRTISTTLLGGFAFLLMTMSMWMSTRPRIAERFFGGLDRMYQVHKFCGVFAGLLVLVHFFTVPKHLPVGVDDVTNLLVPSVPLGMLALITLVLSLALALNRKIPYSKWRNPHKLMGLVYFLAIGHFMTAPIAFFDHFGPSGYLLIGAAIVGVLSFLYSLFGMNKKTATRYTIETVNHLERATEMILRPVGNPIDFKPGQFAFVEVQGKGWQEPHPFTISSSPDERYLRFTMKVLGDWTRKAREELKVGQDVLVRGPYGCFDTTIARRQQVWLAGGIGVTPFLSMARDMKADDPREITLVYAVRDKSEALFIEELSACADTIPNFQLVVLVSNNGDFARVDIMKTKLSRSLSMYDFFLCGPSPMTKTLSKDLKAENVARSQIHTEAFEFR